MRRLRFWLTAALAFLLLFDLYIASNIRLYGLYGDLVCFDEATGKLRPPRFSWTDWLILLALAGVQVALGYLVWRSWRRPPAKTDSVQRQ